MKITRAGLIGASSAITGAVGIVVFLTAMNRGLPPGKALLLAMFCAVPFIVVEELFGIPEHLRFLRANWRAHAAMMLVVIVLIAG